jgi:hypothetical protein
LPGWAFYQRRQSPRRLARATAVLHRKALAGRNGFCQARGSRHSATASYPATQRALELTRIQQITYVPSVNTSPLLLRRQLQMRGRRGLKF